MGYTHDLLVGEVENASASNIRSVYIGAALRDINDRLVYAEEDWTEISVIAAGAKSPFEIILAPTPTWETYELVVNSYRETTDEPIAFEILNHSSYLDWGRFHVAGQVRNQYDVAYDWIEAFVTLYDTSGAVIGVGWDVVEPYTLEPGATGYFDAVVYEWVGAPDPSVIASYDLQVLLD